MSDYMDNPVDHLDSGITATTTWAGTLIILSTRTGDIALLSGRELIKDYSPDKHPTQYVLKAWATAALAELRAQTKIRPGQQLSSPLYWAKHLKLNSDDLARLANLPTY